MTILNAAREAASMGHRKNKQTVESQDNTSAARLGTVEERSSELACGGEFPRVHGHAIVEFVGWYRSEPRLAFNRSVVLRYRFFPRTKEPGALDNKCALGGCQSAGT
jgi:hypothetical protein